MYLCNLNRNNYVVLIPIFISFLIIGMIQIFIYVTVYCILQKIIISHLLNNKDVPFLTNKSMTKAILFFMIML